MTVALKGKTEAEAQWTERWEKDGVFTAGQRPEVDVVTITRE